MSSQEAYHDNNPNFQPDSQARLFVNNASLFMERVSADFGIPPESDEYAIGFYVIQPHDKKKYPYILPHTEIQSRFDSIHYGDEVSQVSMWKSDSEMEVSIETTSRQKSARPFLSKPKGFITVTNSEQGILINGKTPSLVAEEDRAKETDPLAATLFRLVNMSRVLLMADRGMTRNLKDGQLLTRIEAVGRAMLVAPYVPEDSSEVGKNPHASIAHQKAWLN